MDDKSRIWMEQIKSVRMDATTRAIQGRKDRRMSDTISRQAAIEAIEEYADRLQMVDWKENPGVPYKAYALNWCINTIRDLPPAQPDIIQCRNCKFAGGDSRICMKFGHSPIGELDFCSWAERRTDG